MAQSIRACWQCISHSHFSTWSSSVFACSQFVWMSSVHPAWSCCSRVITHSCNFFNLMEDISKRFPFPFSKSATNMHKFLMENFATRATISRRPSCFHDIIERWMLRSHHLKINSLGRLGRGSSNWSHRGAWSEQIRIKMKEKPQLRKANLCRTRSSCCKTRCDPRRLLHHG